MNVFFLHVTFSLPRIFINLRLMPAFTGQNLLNLSSEFLGIPLNGVLNVSSIFRNVLKNAI